MRTNIVAASVIRVLDLETLPPAEVWRGSLLQYVKDNDIDAEAFGPIACDLLHLGFHIVGGGAAPAYMIALVLPAVRVVFAGSPLPLDEDQKRDLARAMRTTPRVAPDVIRMLKRGPEPAAA